MTTLSEKALESPIFVIGMPRSGSTVFHKLMAAHPEIATTRRISRKAPASPTLLKLLLRMYGPNPPAELGSTWDRFLESPSGYMDAEQVTPTARRFYRKLVQTHLEVYPGRVFLAKCPRLGLRMQYLTAIFPEARFLHIIRDGRSVCRSVLTMREKHGGRNTWWDAKPEHWKDYQALPPVESVSRQWHDVIQTIHQAGASLGPDRFLEFRYEDFVESPSDLLTEVGRFCRIHTPDPAQQELMYSLENRNRPWSDTFTTDEITVMNEIMGPYLTQYGYEV